MNALYLEARLVVELRNFSSDTPIASYATPLQLIGTESQRKDLYVYCPKNATQLVLQLVVCYTVRGRGVAWRSV